MRTACWALLSTPRSPAARPASCARACGACLPPILMPCVYTVPLPLRKSLDVCETFEAVHVDCRQFMWAAGRSCGLQAVHVPKAPCACIGAAASWHITSIAHKNGVHALCCSGVQCCNLQHCMLVSSEEF